jgi:hypothetical protein
VAVAASTEALVGRSDEQAALRAALTDAYDGAPSLILLSGDAGIGKTRLLLDLEAEAAASGASVLHGDCVDLGEGELPYAPIVAALRRLDEAPLRRALDDIGGAARRELARLLPTIDDAEPVPDHGVLAQTRLFEVLLLVLREDPYAAINFADFHVRWDTGDPEQGDRDGFGGDLWKYAYATLGYDPVAGTTGSLFPARRLMLAHIARWVLDQRIDGVRVDSVNNVANWDFVGEFRAYARELYRGRAASDGVDASQADARFLVVGEELAMPLDLVRQGRLDVLWNEEFKYALRAALLGRARDGDPSFEWTIRKLVDCRNLGFTDGAQAVNYVTSHDVGNWKSERLYIFLANHGVWDAEPRIKLAFSCLLTAVGIPMILAGEEFADQHDLPILGGKEVDPVNFNRLEDEWRRRVFVHVARLVRLRQAARALAVNDTRFLHADFTPGRRVMAWERGAPEHDPVVVVANFSDWHTENPADPGAEYVVPNWPPTPVGRRWREITQDRDVPAERVGREPLYPWEAKVYTTA